MILGKLYVHHQHAPFKRTNLLFYDYKEVAPFDLVKIRCSIFCHDSAVLMRVGLAGEVNLPTKWHTKV